MSYYLSHYRPMTGLREALERVASNDFWPTFPQDSIRVHLPLNVEVKDQAFEIIALVPGLESQDVKIEIVEDTVSIHGELKTVESEGAYLLREIPAGKFRRTLRLPVALDSEKAEAEIANGVLTLRIPKAKSVLPKTIEVKAK